jgi:hypothetical protein
MEDSADSAWGARAIAAAELSAGTNSADAEPIYKRWTKWIPILGKLWACRPEHLKEAFYEVAIVLLFSTLPLWFFPAISSILFTVELPFFKETVSSGELLIYAASLSGGMVYFISKKYGSIESRPETGEGPMLAVSVSFPYGRFFIILSALICMFAAAVFFMLKVAKYLLSARPTIIDHDGTALTSWLLFLVSAVLFFCAVAYRNMLDDGRSYRNQPAETILDDWDQNK